jgi:ABC-type lipoprotein export system ATPase subunit
MVTHNLDLVSDSDRVVKLTDGRVEASHLQVEARV